MVRIAICDDNDLQRELTGEILEEYISTSEKDITVSSFASGRELLNAVKSKGFFDIYILDLIMPDINGMEVASTLRLMKDEGKIIFLTATLDYAVASYDVNAFYYMIKPVNTQKLYHLLDKATAQISEDSASFELRTHKGAVRIKYDDIMYIDLENRALRYHLKDGRIVEGLVIRVSFKEAVAKFLEEKYFAMCGISAVVNLRCVDQMDSESVLLSDGSLLYPSKSACSALKKVWAVYKND